MLTRRELLKHSAVLAALSHFCCSNVFANDMKKNFVSVPVTGQ